MREGEECLCLRAPRLLRFWLQLLGWSSGERLRPAVQRLVRKMLYRGIHGDYAALLYTL